MKNKPATVLVVILLTETFLLSASWFYENTGLWWVREYIRMVPASEMFGFSQKQASASADSLLNVFMSGGGSQGVLQRRVLSDIGPKKQNIFLTNPATGEEKALDKFFRALASEKDSTVIRIAHYGDSQLEGDRMSWVIRKLIHEKFGGSGIGYVPLKDLSPVSYVRQSSGNWAKYTVFHDRYSNSYYGLSGCVFRFSRHSVHQEEADSSESSMAENQADQNPGQVYYNAGVTLKMGQEYTYSTISFLYGHSDLPCTINVKNSGGGNIASCELEPQSGVAYFRLDIPSPSLNVKVDFSADESPDFYGMYFDGPSGVQVDNYSIRGHSGDGLMLIDPGQLAKMLSLTRTRLVIFQYGANVVPYVRSEKACEGISEMYYNLFMRFRKAAPDISVLVVGSGDMATGGSGGYASYKWLPQINEAQKMAALRAGCAYWDLFNMMGGANSILIWADKKLAVTNGHFSSKGQEIVAKEIVEALMVEYNMYVHKNRKNEGK